MEQQEIQQPQPEEQSQQQNILHPLLQSKWIIGIAVGIVVCIILLFVILFLNPKANQIIHQGAIPAIPTSLPQAKATSYPTTNPALITATLSMQNTGNTVYILLDSGVDAVSGVQLALSYDPKVLTHIQMAPGTFFDQPSVLQHTTDTTKGTITYTLAIQPDGMPKKGQGIVATMTYSTVPGAHGSTSLTFLPDTKITTEGVNDSVLKQTKNLTISLP